MKLADEGRSEQRRQYLRNCIDCWLLMRRPPADVVRRGLDAAKELAAMDITEVRSEP